MLAFFHYYNNLYILLINMKYCYNVFDRGIKVLSVFAFSTENWKRDKEEVDYLMDLFLKAFKVLSIDNPAFFKCLISSVVLRVDNKVKFLNKFSFGF